MAKKSKKTGLNINVGSAMYIERCIVMDHDGVPWVVDPKKGTVTLADVHMPAVSKGIKK